MLDAFIPNSEDELRALESIAPGGFVIGFGLRYGQPDFFLNRYPDAWTALYEQENYFFGDPVAAWTITRTGSTRWTDVKFPDPRGIMKEARNHKMNYGATFVTKMDRKRSFMSVARPDRELDDSEMMMLHSKLEIWAKMFARSRVSLTEGELAALISIRDGARQAEAAETLKVSLSTLKLRLDSAQKKLGAPNTLSAVVMAVRRNMI
ncbi:autoinducer binding domain-containing protein [Paracoccus sp. 1_MG-2023]|uniref:helix-turn-helix transcriptional regulator n=1 Tax=unclassified Paracoccus (in: a-proteobacteria) TaxID=2688777 RepID=UPI001C08A64E|nr:MULTISPECIES: autoinducer binding domain-containing protein [unclassified Paracoccus (in: a-proteobacteria)]MBU2956122.1 autoinducer binding domain-containing protein [Paracoccus sp. C2R09]MDO6670390.1 autoinducer binding domain-containing protein [Paracoccus sp. 1_MG-2023]